jgi:hypothetical protein
MKNSTKPNYDEETALRSSLSPPPSYSSSVPYASSTPLPPAQEWDSIQGDQINVVIDAGDAEVLGEAILPEAEIANT